MARGQGGVVHYRLLNLVVKMKIVQFVLYV
jgi:hypothetical protein